jgi:hypothetical protein
MSFFIGDGKGRGRSAGVNQDNQLLTRSVSVDSQEQGTVFGESFNVNTGLITLTTADESGVLYVKNTYSSRNVVVTGIVAILGPSTGGSTTDTTRIRIYRNPTTGTLITDATAVDTNSNRNFGEDSTLTADAYKGTEGSTITDGTVHLESLVNPGNRVFFSIDEMLQPGNSIAVSYEPNDSNTSMKCMTAIVCHLLREE